MKKLSLSFVGIALLISASNAQALEVIVSATAGGTTQEIEKVVSQKLVKQARPVFSPNERGMLRGVGRVALADAMKFSVESPVDYQTLSEYVRVNRLRVRLEPAEIRFQVGGPRPQQTENAARATKAARFEGLQWAIKNIGQAVSIALDDLTSLFVKGKPGEDIGIDRAQKENADLKRRITIAVLDTGVDFSHPELLDQVTENVPECRALAEHTKCLKDASALQNSTPALIAEAKKACDAKYIGKDFDGNGYPLDCSGWNLTAKAAPGSTIWGDNDARDNIGHGTHVAGIIAARSNDADGISGVISNARILPVKVITASPTEPIRPTEVGVISAPTVSTTLPSPEESSLKSERGLGDLVARGMLYAIRSNSNVINMSLGWPADVDSNLMSQMIDLARSRGILVVAASGNDGTDALIRPCVFENVICVASHDPDGAISHFSNHGAGVDIAAPGLGILSLFPTNMSSWVFTDRVGYEQKSGTSMASPYIAGLLARLLNAGYSAEEARARLLLGTRTIAKNPRVQRVRDMVVQTGNADLELAFKVGAQPLVLPTSKRPIQANWDRLSSKVSLGLDLENYWAEAKSATIEVSVLGTSALDAEVTPKKISANGWKAGERKSFPMELVIKSNRLESELLVELKITTVDAKTNASKTETRYAAIEVVSTPTAADPEVENRPLSGDAALIGLIPKSGLRSVQSLDGSTRQDYFIINDSPNGMKLALMTEQAAKFDVQYSLDLPTPKGTLMVLQRVDLDMDGSSDYVLVWKQSPTAGTRFPIFQFRFFDARLRPKELTFDGKKSSVAEYGNTISVITDRFQWLKMGNQKVPAWISRGTTPEAEKPAFDPWNPNPLDLPSFRLFYWGAKGLATIPIDDKTPVAFLPQSREEMRTGKLKSFWVSGEDTESVYETGLVYDGAVHGMKVADFGGYRKIRPTMLAPLLNMNESNATSGETIGAGFYSESFRSAQRLTAYTTEKGVMFDTILQPLSQTDAIAMVLAAFAGDRHKSLIAQTIYELQYHDISSGEVATASLKKFSFMPGFFFQRLFYPVVGDDSTSATTRIPMIYLAQGLGTGSSMEITSPRYEAGKLMGLVRPARLRMVPPQGCESMGDPLDASETKPSRVSFVCLDRVMYVPLKY